MSELNESAPPVPPPEVQSLIDAGNKQGLVVRDLKAAKASKEEIDEAVKELLRLKGLVPIEFQPPKKDNKKDKKKNKNTADERAKKKEAVRLAREKAAADKKAKQKAQEASSSNNYGELPLPQSRKGDKTNRKWTKIENIDSKLVGEKVLVRGFLNTMRAQSSVAFCVIRQSFATVQCVCSEPGMVKWCPSVNNESVVDISGVVVKAPNPTKATQNDVEIQIESFFIVNRSSVSLPFQVTDCEHTVEEMVEMKKKEEEGKGKAIIVGQDLKLNHRHLSLRSPYQAAIMRVSSGVCHFFREYLNDQGFIEIQTPKLLGGSSEGGAEIFMTDYFGTPAFLAQSPQLHKQISAACSGLERVFEIGPVFRAENSNTNRHLCEFHGLDMEMAFHEHYHEVLDVFSDLFHHIFNGLNAKYSKEIKLIHKYHPATEFVATPPAETFQKFPNLKTVGNSSKTLLLEYTDAIKILRERGITESEMGDLDDLPTEIEKKLGKWVKEIYGVDWYMLDKFPLDIRPFYTMPCPEDPRYSNSYDFFIRGQEILSGAQRQHHAPSLTEAIIKKGIAPESLKFYIDAFKDGALPHGGGGIGLERVVMLFLGLQNIRDACFFVRDPQRIIP